MLIIKNECAGSGKTFGIAENVFNDLKVCSPNKKIYAITHTNYAKKEIREELLKKISFIPENVIVETIDTFLLKKVIYPFSKIILNYDYNSCSIVDLPPENNYKSHYIKVLKDNGIIHTSKILSESLKIFSWKNKKERKFKEKFFSFFSSDIYKIYIDETQDMPQEGIDLIKCLVSFGLNIYCVGDFRQDLKGYNAFKEMLEQAKNKKLVFNGIVFDSSSYKVIEKNETRRNPQAILNISNTLYDDEYSCTSIKSNGKITYSFFNNDFSSDKISSFDLAYIYKKTDSFHTEKNLNYEIDFTKEEKEILCRRFNDNSNFNVDIIVNEFVIYLENGCSNVEAYKKISLKYGFEYNSSIYSKFMKYKINETKQVFLVKSIDKVKGGEGEKCLFIATHNMINILLNNGSDNKEKNKLYVALTRTKYHLHILIYDVVKTPFSKELIQKFMNDNNIEYLEL